MSDIINSPPHYTKHPSGIEAYEVLQHFNFNVGNGLKYLWRADLKHDSPNEDLLKAHWYFKREYRRLNDRPERAWVRMQMGRVIGADDSLLGNVLTQLTWQVLRRRPATKPIEVRLEEIERVVVLVEFRLRELKLKFKSLEEEEEEGD